MKIADFIQKNIDIDVYDDYTEELGIAFCGPVELTDEGKRVFADVMNFDIEIYPECAVVAIDADNEDACEDMLVKAKKFFFAAAGYCDESEYDKWFVEQE